MLGACITSILLGIGGTCTLLGTTRTSARAIFPAARTLLGACITSILLGISDTLFGGTCIHTLRGIIFLFIRILGSIRVLIVLWVDHILSLSSELLLLIIRIDISRIHTQEWENT